MYSVKKRFRQLIRQNLKKKFYDKGFIYDEFDAPLGVVFRTKRINDFFLSIAYMTRRWEDDLFTCEYCLSRICMHNQVFKDLTYEHMARIGELITQEEKEAIFPPRYAKKGIIDPWWQVNDEDDFINNLKKNAEFVIECAERFDTQDRRNSVLASKELDNRVRLLNEVFKNAEEQKNLSPITEQEIYRKLEKHKGFLNIGKSLQYLAVKQGLNLSKAAFLNLVQDCYKMYYVQYPNPKVQNQ